MKIQDFFDKGYFINLDKRQDRKKLFEEEVSKIGLKNYFTRFTACEPYLDDVDLQDYTLQSYRKLGACGKSHKKIIEIGIKENLNNVLIFEDDIIFYNEGTTLGINLIESGLDTLSQIPDWDIVYFGGILYSPKTKRVGENLLKVESVLTTHAWGINKRTFEKFLDYMPNDGKDKHNFSIPLDIFIGNHPDLNKYLIYPLAVYQRCKLISDCNANPEAILYTEDCVGPWLKNYNDITIYE
jgi:GR25 family glycosyltransferase involved in LPS biosynthesis